MKITSRYCHANIVKDGALRHNEDHFSYLMFILNLEGQPNCIIGSKVTAIELEYVE